MGESKKGPKSYREGDQPENSEQKGFVDKSTGEQVTPITAVLLILTDDGVDMLSEIRGLDVRRPATLHDVVMMASAAGAEATAKISSQYTADAMMRSMALAQRAMAMTPPSQGPMVGPGGVPIIGRGGRGRGN